MHTTIPIAEPATNTTTPDIPNRNEITLWSTHKAHAQKVMVAFAMACVMALCVVSTQTPGVPTEEPALDDGAVSVRFVSSAALGFRSSLRFSHAPTNHRSQRSQHNTHFITRDGNSMVMTSAPGSMPYPSDKGPEKDVQLESIPAFFREFHAGAKPSRVLFRTTVQARPLPDGDLMGFPIYFTETVEGSKDTLTPDELVMVSPSTMHTDEEEDVKERVIHGSPFGKSTKYAVLSPKNTPEAQFDHWAIHENIQLLPSLKLVDAAPQSPRDIFPPIVAPTHLYTMMLGKDTSHVSSFVTSYLPYAIRTHPSFASDLPTAVREAFHIVDRLLFNHVLGQGGKITSDAKAAGTAVVLRDSELLCATVGGAKAVLVSDTIGLDEQSRFVTGDLTRVTITDLTRPEPESPLLTKDSMYIAEGPLREDIPVYPNMPHSGQKVPECPVEAPRGFGQFVCKASMAVDPEMSYTRLQPSDRYLIVATPDVWEVISSSELGGVVESVGSDPNAIAHAIVSLARSRQAVHLSVPERLSLLERLSQVDSGLDSVPVIYDGDTVVPATESSVMVVDLAGMKTDLTEERQVGTARYHVWMSHQDDRPL